MSIGRFFSVWMKQLKIFFAVFVLRQSCDKPFHDSLVTWSNLMTVNGKIRDSESTWKALEDLLDFTAICRWVSFLVTIKFWNQRSDCSNIYIFDTVYWKLLLYATSLIYRLEDLTLDKFTSLHENALSITQRPDEQKPIKTRKTCKVWINHKQWSWINNL